MPGIFEKERYDWNLKLCTDLTEYNKRFPSKHIISAEHVVETLLIPQTAFHVQHAQGVRQFVSIVIAFLRRQREMMQRNAPTVQRR